MSMKRLRKEIFDTIDSHRRETEAWKKAAQTALAETVALGTVAQKSLDAAEESSEKLKGLAEYAASNLEEIRALLAARTELRTYALETAITLERRQLEYSKQDDMGGFVHIYNNQLAGIMILLPKILDISGTEALKLVREMAADTAVKGRDE